MRKLLLTAAAAATFASSTALADTTDFYIDAHVGAHFLSKENSVSADTGAFMGAGVGYYFNEMFRADVTFEHLFEPKHSGKVGGVKRSAEGDVNAIFLNAYAHVLDAEFASFFIGGGVGGARVSSDAKIGDKKEKQKADTGFAWAAHAGASTELSHGIHGTLQYSYKHYGNGKKPTGAILKNFDYKGHHVGVGVRFDI